MARQTIGCVVVALLLGFSVTPSLVAQVPPADATVARINVPQGAYWAGQEILLEGRQCVTHSHGLEFVYALAENAVVRVGGQTTSITQGTAGGIAAGTVHSHCGPQSRFLAFQLAPTEASWGNATVVRSKRTEVLSGYRTGVQNARILEVRLQPLTQSAVHTHPGPEAFYIVDGPIVVQTEGKLAMLLRGDMLALPGDTPLQGRYIGGTGIGRWLALFVIAEGAPFSVPIPAGFKTPPAP